LELNYLAENYTGPVDANVQLVYCGTNRTIADYTFEFTEKTVLDREFNSETLQASRSQAEIDINVKNGDLIPISTPDYWNARKADIENNTAVLEYYSTLYKPKEIEYAVLNSNGSVIGKTTVDTTPPDPTWRDKLKNNFWVMFAGLLVLSVAANLYLLRRRIIPDILLEKLAEIEFEDRDIRKN